MKSVFDRKGDPWVCDADVNPDSKAHSGFGKSSYAEEYMRWDMRMTRGKK
jgi:hypothetical protein